jgi:hypothetical protein
MGKDMWQVPFIEHNYAGSPDRDFRGFAHFIRFAVDHIDYERDSFPNGSINRIACHEPKLS